MRVLAGDIGGTKTHLALYAVDGASKLEREEKFVSKDYPSLLEIVKLFLDEEKEKVDGACFGVAGPVREGKCKATNLAWMIDVEELRKELKTDAAWLINDIEADCWGINALKEEDFFVINKGEKQEGNRAIVAAGTGLGEGGMYWDGKSHCPFACEGGHVDFAPRDEMEMELLRFLKRLHKHVSYERVVCGGGLYLLYRFLTDMRLENPSEELTAEFALKSPASVISEKALKGQDKACVRALEWFMSIYASECGNVALKFLALGGVYLGGGIAPKNLKAINPETFMKSFSAKGRFAELLSSIPVKVILKDDSGIHGAVQYVVRLIAQTGR